MTRYADGPSRHVEIDIAATPETVWGLVRDISLMPRFSPELQETNWVDGCDRVVQGARFRGRNINKIVGEWETICTVLSCEPGHEMTWTPSPPDEPAVVWGFRVSPSGNGATLRQSVRVGPIVGLFHARFIAPDPERESKILDTRLDQLEAAMRANVTGIRELAESGRAD
jgi:uncharacterized protein YndB with AHSA1/START domain